jgi:hypothetical protein
MLNFFRSQNKPIQSISSFQKIYTKSNNGHEISFFDPISKKQIIYVRYKPNTGQIGILDVNKEFQKKGFGKQVIKFMENELSKVNQKEIWVACSQNHFYWSKLSNFSFRNPIHESVTGSGYFKKIDN